MDEEELLDNQNINSSDASTFENISYTQGPDSSDPDDVVDELSGIIYISRIPPYMGLSKLRSYFSNFGKIGKIYAHPEPIGEYNKRVKMGGNKNIKFTHGWIQFHDKKVAKRVANILNNKPVLDEKRRSFWREDLWNIKYLPKFKWRHLVEYWSSNKRERKDKLHSVLSKERKQNYHYLEQLEVEKREFHMENKKKNKKSDSKEGDKVESNLKVKKNKPKNYKAKNSRDKNPKTQKNELPMDLLNSIVL